MDQVSHRRYCPIQHKDLLSRRRERHSASELAGDGRLFQDLLTLSLD